MTDNYIDCYFGSGLRRVEIKRDLEILFNLKKKNTVEDDWELGL